MAKSCRVVGQGTGWGRVWGVGQWRLGSAEQHYLHGARARSNRIETRELDVREP